MRNIQRIEALQLFQGLPSYCQVVSAVGIEKLTSRSESTDEVNEMYQERLKEYEVALERLISHLDKIKEFNFD